MEVKELLTDFEKIRNYVRRGKKNWFLRKLKNATFKIATEEKVIETINKLTKKKIKVPSFIVLGILVFFQQNYKFQPKYPIVYNKI